MKQMKLLNLIISITFTVAAFAFLLDWPIGTSLMYGLFLLIAFNVVRFHNRRKKEPKFRLKRRDDDSGYVLEKRNFFIWKEFLASNKSEDYSLFYDRCRRTISFQQILIIN